MIKKRLPIGIDDFKTIIENNYYYADKSLLIKELIDGGAVATLIPRPRRFGKTLNLSMLKYFFEKTDTSHTDLFKDLAIARDASSMNHQGQYPVIFLTFKDAKWSTWESVFSSIRSLICDEFRRHKYLLASPLFDEYQKLYIQSIIAQTASYEDYAEGLKKLSEFLFVYHNKRAIILIDEYDMPIHAGYMHGYYTKIIEFMCGFLSAGLKNNLNLERSVLTGILRVAKESIFSGLNNLEVCSILSNAYADKFGLIEEEVKAMLGYFNIECKLDQVRSWYDGYTFGNKRIYNPWSIINFAKTGNLTAHWVNTSDNAIIKSIIAQSGSNEKEELEQLMAGGTITKQIEENIVFQDLEKGSRTIWNFFLFTGYLTFSNYRCKDVLWYADLSIPNNEVLSLYHSIIIDWFDQNVNPKTYLQMLNALTNGKFDDFQELFYAIVHQCLSNLDVGGDEPEKFYHALVLGMLVSLNTTHMVRSNRESGLGKYDVMIVPRDTSKLGIIIEFKKVKANETLQTAAANALKQIEDRQYETELHQQGITKILKLAIVFEGKQVLVVVG